MTEVTRHPEPVSQPIPQVVQSGESRDQVAGAAAARASVPAPAANDEINLDELLANNPALKASFDRLAGVSSKQTDEEVFSINTLYRNFIALTKSLQEISTVYANRLTKTTEKINALSDMMNAIEYVDDTEYKGYGGKATDTNQRLSAYIEKARIEKDKQSGYAQSTTTLMQTLKDATQTCEEGLSTNLSIMQRIMDQIAK